MRLLWNGDWLDAKLSLFCDDEDKEVKVIHFRVESLDLLVTGEVEATLKTPIEDRIREVLVVVEKRYMETIAEQKELVIKQYGFPLQ